MTDHAISKPVKSAGFPAYGEKLALKYPSGNEVLPVPENSRLVEKSAVWVMSARPVMAPAKTVPTAAMAIDLAIIFLFSNLVAFLNNPNPLMVPK